MRKKGEKERKNNRKNRKKTKGKNQKICGKNIESPWSFVFAVFSSISQYPLFPHPLVSPVIFLEIFDVNYSCPLFFLAYLTKATYNLHIWQWRTAIQASKHIPFYVDKNRLISWSASVYTFLLVWWGLESERNKRVSTKETCNPAENSGNRFFPHFSANSSKFARAETLHARPSHPPPQKKEKRKMMKIIS